MYSCGPDEIPLEREETTKVDSQVITLEIWQN